MPLVVPPLPHRARGTSNHSGACQEVSCWHDRAMTRLQHRFAVIGVLLASLLAFFVDPAPSAFGATRSTLTPLSAPPAQPASPESPPTLARAVTAKHRACQHTLDVAFFVGWPKSALRELERITWRESRCQRLAKNHNRNGTVDRGVTQLNDVNFPYLEDRGVVSHPHHLFRLEANLKAALAVWQRDSGFCSWDPPDYC